MVKPFLSYGEECWLVKSSDIQKMHVAEMWMLRWMCGHTRSYKIKNKVINKKVEVSFVANKTREARD